jgi:AcrR family transcriptional regulator
MIAQAIAGAGLDVSKQKSRPRRLSSEDRRTQILQAAIEFFAEEGFDGSTHTLAKRMGVTQPLIYRYFPSKDDLVREVYNSIFESRWQIEWEALLRDRRRTLRERLVEFYGLYTDVVFARDWMRIYLFSGLKGLDINRWWTRFVETRILATICDECRHENRATPVAKAAPTARELELLWIFQGSIFYYAMRRDVYRARVHLDFGEFLRLSIDSLFLTLAAEQRSLPVTAETVKRSRVKARE